MMYESVEYTFRGLKKRLSGCSTTFSGGDVGLKKL